MGTVLNLVLHYTKESIVFVLHLCKLVFYKYCIGSTCIVLTHFHVIFNTNKILMQYCILLVLYYSIALVSFFCWGMWIFSV